jgi:hypothetical protein
VVHVTDFTLSGTGAAPVLLETESVIQITGLVKSQKGIHFGITTKELDGRFSGHHEVRISSEKLGPIGTPWTVHLRVDDFHSANPENWPSATDMELAHIFVYVNGYDPGLEIHSVAVLPNSQPVVASAD